MEAPICMTYIFNVMKFEFRADGEIFITDLRWTNKYRFHYNESLEYPFMITLLEKNVKE